MFSRLLAIPSRPVGMAESHFLLETKGTGMTKCACSYRVSGQFPKRAFATTRTSFPRGAHFEKKGLSQFAAGLGRSYWVLRPPNDKYGWVFQSETAGLLRRTTTRYPMEVMIGPIRALQLLSFEVTAKSWLCCICGGGIGLKRGDPHRLIPLGMADNNLDR